MHLNHRSRCYVLAGLAALIAQGCIVTPTNDEGLRERTTPFDVTGYSPLAPPFTVNVQQEDQNTHAWETVTTLQAQPNGASVQLSDGVWYPWKFRVSLNGLPRYWHSTRASTTDAHVRFMSNGYQIPYFSEPHLSSECFRQKIGQGGQAVVDSCMKKDGSLVINSCARGDAGVDCGPAGYPTAKHREVIAKLSGAALVNSTDRLTGRFTEAQKSKARAYLEQEFRAAGLSTEIDGFCAERTCPGVVCSPCSETSNVGANVVGRLLASTSPLAGQPTSLIVVGAHFDSSGEMVPGALDNAAGVAMVVDLAKHLASLPTRAHEVMFVAFDSEEFGLFGSKHFAARAREWVTTGRYKVHSAHFVDEIGEAKEILKLEAPQGTYAPLTNCLWDMYSQINASEGLNVPLARYVDTSGTDHMSMLTQGFRAVSMTETVTGGVTGKHKPCAISCDAACGGDCAAGKYCAPTDRSCDVYQNMKGQYLASASLLYRAVLAQLVSGRATQCN
jgi:hypothetical protein